jgi:hypothetical protein
MKFKPFTEKHVFTGEALVRIFPDYMRQPITSWILKLFSSNQIVFPNYYSVYELSQDFVNELQLVLRRTFPQNFNDAMTVIYSDEELTADFLALCLQNYATSSDGKELENILAIGGSAYEVTRVKREKHEYEMGTCDLMERVAPIVKVQATEVLSQSNLLREAWDHCYSRNPDYEKVVIKCQDFLETFLRDRYMPNDSKPQIGKIIGNLKKSSDLMNFKGASVLANKSDLLLLIDNIAQYRGLHTGGTGKVPSKEEAEFFLHSTILIWNLHQ